MKSLIAATAALGLALTSAVAHETVIEKNEDGKRTIVKIVRHGDGEPDGHEGQMKGCEGGEAAADIDEDVSKDGKRQRILICAKAGDASADAAKHLAEARERIAKDENLSAEVKAKVLASLDAAIARQSKP